MPISRHRKPKRHTTSELICCESFLSSRRNARLVELVIAASAVQQKLVAKANDLPEVSTDTLSTDTLKNIVLTNRSGNESPDLSDEVVYVRVHGAILAFSAIDGKLLWRRYVGNSEESSPVPVNPGGQDGALLSDTTSFEVQRTDSKTGAIQWRTKIGEEFSQPVAYDGVVYLSTKSGTLVAFDAETGDPSWASKIPQPLEESPGINIRMGKLYLTGDHSNLYVIDKRTGECSESFYIGHAKGTVSVPPITLEGNNGGHVFVIENKGTDYALLHILKCDAQGGALTVSQPPERLVGNVHVPPIMVLGRRLIVLTDRGEIKSFDIEQSAAVSEQVKESAKQVASYDAPTNVQMAVGKNQMWVTGSRIRRFELQVSTGKVNPGWLLYEGDSFIGAPYLIGDTLIHARVLKGTTGVRVTAANPTTGEPYWQTDVGVPVSMLTTKPDGKGFHAVTSQAALFELDAQSLAEGATSGPIENPGGTGASMRFEQPRWIDKDRAVFVNLATSGQICVYDPTRAKEKLRLMTLAMPPSRIDGDGVIAGEGLVLPLESGRVVYMDWQTGAQLGSPFQPASSPDKPVRWSMPVVLSSDASQVVIADDRKRSIACESPSRFGSLAAADLQDPLLKPLCVIGEKIVGSASGPSADFLVCFDANSLAETARVLLDGRITWGPFAAEDRVVLQTDDGVLRTYDSAGKVVAEPVSLDPGQLVPGVKLIGDVMIITSRSGWFAAINKSTGAMIGKIDLHQPLSALPLEVGKRLLVPGAEGLVYISEIPTAAETP
jgi:outer membrane protein assembly factor BamB